VQEIAARELEAGARPSENQSRL